MSSWKNTLNKILSKKRYKSKLYSKCLFRSKELKLICSINGPQYIINTIIEDYKLSVS